MLTKHAALQRADRLLRAIDDKAADLNELRWSAAHELHQAVQAGVGYDAIAAELGRKRAVVVSYVTTWIAYGDDKAVRAEQTYSGLQRLVSRYPDDPAARAAIIDQARAEGCSVATVMDHQGYRGRGQGGHKGRSSHDPDSAFLRQLLALGAPLDVEQAGHGLDTALHHLTALERSQAALGMDVVRLVGERLAAVQAVWAGIVGTAELADMATGGTA